MLANTHALLIGIADYQQFNPLPPIVLNDAQALAEALIDPALCVYPPENVITLLNQQATHSALRQSLADLATRTNADSTVFLYFSGHGIQLAVGTFAGEYLLPIDANVTSPEQLANTAISGAEFSDALRAIPARKVVVVLDCCHSGGIGQPKEASAFGFKTGFSESYYDQLKRGTGRVILAASRSSEYSWILPGDENSLFTKHLLAGLRGGITSADGLIRIFDLFEYIQPRVTGEHPNQHPIFKAEIEENFPIALSLGGKKISQTQQEQSSRYDAYISFVDQGADSKWVWEELIPRLEAVGLRLAISGDVEEPGVARVVNIERGIRQSKRSILVLSKAYLSNNFSEFENTLAQTMGIQEGTYRLLPVTIEEIDGNRLPTRLSMLTTLDLTHPRRAEREFQRLIQAVKSPLPN